MPPEPCPRDTGPPAPPPLADPMVPVLEAVPNFSEGRDRARVRALAELIAREGVDVLDWSADPDHHRSVITFVGDPATVERAAVAAAAFALESIDLRTHRGVHPRVGALDVLPLVPLQGLTLEDARASALRVGRALVELGLPVYFYGAASSPPGRRLAEIRKGGFEALQAGWPPGREPDLAPPGVGGPHPTAGAVCVGARPLLLAWNVEVEGVALEVLRGVARDLRETGGGFPGLRVLALELESRGRRQLSMNLEDLERVSPFAVLESIEERIGALGGRVTATEVIGMFPDPLVLPAAADRLRLLDSHPSRLLSAGLAGHVSERAAREAEALIGAVRRAGSDVPGDVREAARRLHQLLSRGSPSPGPGS